MAAYDGTTELRERTRPARARNSNPVRLNRCRGERLPGDRETDRLSVRAVLRDRCGRYRTVWLPGVWHASGQGAGCDPFPGRPDRRQRSTTWCTSAAMFVRLGSWAAHASARLVIASRVLCQRDRQPGARQLTVRHPRVGSARAGSQSHGDQVTMTLPGPQRCPCSHAQVAHQRATQQTRPTWTRLATAMS
jgi:hypothetical protein